MFAFQPSLLNFSSTVIEFILLLVLMIFEWIYNHTIQNTIRINMNSLLKQSCIGQSDYYSTRESLMTYEGKKDIHHISHPDRMTVAMIENGRTAVRAWLI